MDSTEEDGRNLTLRVDEKRSFNNLENDEHLGISQCADAQEECGDWNVGLLSTIVLVTKHCRCPLCHLLIIDCTSLTCGHLFCNFCVQQWFKYEWSCPVCADPKSKNRHPIAKRVYALDHFITDFQHSIHDYIGEDWNSGSLPTTFNDLDWSYDRLKMKLDKYNNGQSRAQHLSQAQRDNLTELRRLYLTENPVILADPDPPILASNLEEYPLELMAGYAEEYPFPMAYSFKFWLWIALAILLHMLQGVWSSGNVGGMFSKLLVSIFVTIAARTWFYGYRNTDEPNPKFRDWFVIKASIHNLPVRQVAPLTEHVNWNEMLKLILDHTTGNPQNTTQE